MGTFVFKWPYPAKDVHVTGTFDDWSKSEQLHQVGDHWEKEVVLPTATQKIYYKFVVDDEWIVDKNAPTEGDGHHNTNNVLLPEQIVRRVPDTTGPHEFDKSADKAPSSPGHRVVALSDLPPGQNPFGESSGAAAGGAAAASSEIPGAFPEEGEQTVKVDPLPATGHSDIQSSVTTSKEDYERAGGEGAATGAFSAQPLPAEGHSDVQSSVTTSKEDYEKAGGEGTADSTVTAQPIPATGHDDTQSTATTSKEAYEKAGILGAAGAAVAGAAAAVTSVFSAPKSDDKNIIPESSLPMDAEKTDTLDKGPFINSVGAGSTTADLAANVPLEPKREATVIGSDAPASAATGAAPIINSSGPGTTTAALASQVPLEQKRQGMVLDTDQAAAAAVPEPVKESIQEAGQSPEAASSPQAVAEKSALEKELMSKVPETQASGEPASAAATQSSYYGLATNVPATVEASMKEAGSPQEAASSAAAVAEKTDLERELTAKVPKTDSAGEPAPVISAATSEAAPAATAVVAAGVGAAAVGGAALASSSHHAPGSSPSAGAAVADGAADSSADAGAVTTKPVVPEKTEGATTEYAPPRDAATTPGVSSTAAAALSDGTEDPTLSEEPAVKMMNKNDAETAATTATAATADKNDMAAPGVAGAATTGSTAAVAATTAHDATTKDKPATSTTAPETPKKTTASSSATAGAAAKSATSTPAKSEAGTSMTEDGKKKKRHRISGFFKKIFD